MTNEERDQPPDTGRSHAGSSSCPCCGGLGVPPWDNGQVPASAPVFSRYRRLKMLLLHLIRRGNRVAIFGLAAGSELFSIAEAVGRRGRVIAVVSSRKQLALAENNLKAFRLRTSLDNIELLLGPAHRSCLAPSTVDTVYYDASLDQDIQRMAVFCEAHQGLREGGRMLMLFQRASSGIVSEAAASGGAQGVEAPRSGADQVRQSLGAALEAAGFDRIRFIGDDLESDTEESAPESHPAAERGDAIRAPGRKGDDLDLALEAWRNQRS